MRKLLPLKKKNLLKKNMSSSQPIKSLTVNSSNQSDSLLSYKALPIRNKTHQNNQLMSNKG